MAKKKAKKKTVTVSLGPEEALLVGHLLEEARSGAAENLVRRITESRVAQAFLERLAPDTPRAGEISRAVAEAFPEKPVQKAFRRAVYRMKTAGIATEGLIPDAQETAPLLKPLPSEEPEAYVGMPGAGGDRAFLMLLHRRPVGVDLATGVLSDEKGFLDFMWAPMSKRQAREMKAEILEKGGPLVETPLAHLYTLLEKAYALSDESQQEARVGYLELRPWLQQNAQLLEGPAVFQHLAPSDIPQDPLTPSQIRDLFETRMFMGWIPSLGDIEPFVEKMGKVAESPLVLTDQQKADRIEEIRLEFLRGHYTEERRRLLKERLEEAAYILFRMGERNEALRCLRAAMDVMAEDTNLNPNTILRFLTQSAFELAEAMETGMREEGDAANPFGSVPSTQ